MIIFGYLNDLFFDNILLPQNAHVTLATTPIFLLGFLFRKTYNKRPYYLLWIPSIIISLLLIVCRSKEIIPQLLFITYDMKRADYGTPVISLLLAIGLILFSIDLSKFLVTRVSLFSKLFGLLGQASMVILCLHMTFIYALRGVNSEISYFNLFIFSTILSLMSYFIILKFSVTRAFLLGIPSDFKKIVLRT